MVQVRVPAAGAGAALDQHLRREEGAGGAVARRMEGMPCAQNGRQWATGGVGGDATRLGGLWVGGTEGASNALSGAARGR